VNVTPCLIGYELRYDSEFGGLTCQCYEDLEYFRNCEDDQYTILSTVDPWEWKETKKGIASLLNV